MSENKNELNEIQGFIARNVDVIKPNFGVMFWQLSELQNRLSPEEFADQGLNLELQEADDEVVAEFLAIYLKLWRDSNDLNAASRFVASRLGMTADELIQTRQLYMDSYK